MEATFEITELILLVFWIRNPNAVQRSKEVYQSHTATREIWSCKLDTLVSGKLSTQFVSLLIPIQSS